MGVLHKPELHDIPIVSIFALASIWSSFFILSALSPITSLPVPPDNKLHHKQDVFDDQSCCC